MQVHSDFSAFQHVKNPIVTIGTFDGVHMGHRSILNRITELAREQNGESVVLTFTPHPRTVLFPEDHGITLLSDTKEKRKLMAECGIDHLIEFPFTLEFARKSAFEYVRDLLVVGIHAHTVVIGYDHRFGRGREGNYETLLELADTFQFAVEEIPAKLIHESEISSTKIRTAIQEGDFAYANSALGGLYGLRGEVVTGEQKGRTIGFPTANIKISDPLKLIPSNGVYQVQVCVEGKEYKGAMNIGVRPTVSSEAVRSLEVHIVAFDEDIYGKEIEVKFLRKIRNEHKFESFDALKEQIARDVQEASN